MCIRDSSIGYFTHASGYGECAATESFLEELAKHPGDIRTELFAKETDNGYDGTYPQKYKGRDGQIYVNNPKVVRLSEVYLIAAEAALKAGDTSAAAGYMNTLRKNRIEDVPLHHGTSSFSLYAHECFTSSNRLSTQAGNSCG